MKYISEMGFGPQFSVCRKNLFATEIKFNSYRKYISDIEFGP